MTKLLDEAGNRRDRLILRCVIEFMLDESRQLVLFHERNFTRAAVYLASLQACSHAALPARGASVSVRAIALSLGLPYESGRRHVRGLEAAGILVKAPDGGTQVTPAGQVGLRSTERLAERRVALLALIADLKALGVEFETEAEPAQPTADLNTAIADLLDDFTLRVLEASSGPHGSMLDALIFTGLLSANARSITYDRDLATRFAWSHTPPPDDLRRPATVTELAARLGLPNETIRRHISRFRDLGWVERVRAGFLASMARQQAPEVLRSGQIIVQNFVQLVRAAQRAGLDVAAVPPQVRRSSDG